MRAPVGGRELEVGGQTVLHGPHDALGLEGADEPGRPRAGQVVEGREGSAVGKPRLGLDDVGVAARAAVRDGAHAAGLAPELSAYGVDVGGVGHGSRAQRGALVRTGITVLASSPAAPSVVCTDFHSVPYQATGAVAFFAVDGAGASDGSSTT